MQAKQIVKLTKQEAISKAFLNSKDIMVLCDCEQTKACEIMRIIKKRYHSPTPLKNQIRKADFLEYYRVSEQDFKED